MASYILHVISLVAAHRNSSSAATFVTLRRRTTRLHPSSLLYKPPPRVTPLHRYVVDIRFADWRGFATQIETPGTVRYGRIDTRCIHRQKLGYQAVETIHK